MDNDEVDFFARGLFLGSVLGVFATILITTSLFHIGAVANNVAHYDSKTGNFTWNYETNSTKTEVDK